MEANVLLDHQVHDLVVLTSVPRREKVMESRVFFNHGTLNPRLVVQAHSQVA